MSNTSPPLVVIAAGGTGGHLFPAEALSVALGQRGAIVDLATDERATRYGAAFPARTTHIIPSATLRKDDPKTYVTAPLSIVQGVLQGRGLLQKLRPAAVIGFGGYPTVPPVLAACWLGVPTLIHEQNGVLGRANRLLAPFVRVIATGFPGVLDSRPKLAAKAVVTGNPVRPAVVAASKVAYAPATSSPLKLVVFPRQKPRLGPLKDHFAWRRKGRKRGRLELVHIELEKFLQKKGDKSRERSV